MILASGQRIAKTMQPNSRMVLRFGPRHLVENGLVGVTDDAIVGQEGRRQYIAGIPRQNLLNLNGGESEPISVDVLPEGWRGVVAFLGDSGDGFGDALPGKRLVAH